MPLPRMTTRRWMLAVALVAAGFGWRQGWNHYQRIAERHWRSTAYRVGGDDLAVFKRAIRRSEYHALLARKYERASWVPFLPVAPDPPPPE